MRTRPNSTKKRRSRSSSNSAISSMSTNTAARCGWASGSANLKDGSLAREVYHGEAEIGERHRHRYEFNPEYRDVLEKEGLVFSGVSPDGKFVEMIELPREVHPYFIACQFHPEYKSKPLAVHPLFDSFVQAAWQNRLHSENLEHDVTSDKQVEMPEHVEAAGVE